MLKHVLFVMAVLAQVAILGVKPAERLMIRREGAVVTLQARLAESHGLLGGYGVAFDYEIAKPPESARENGLECGRVWTVVKKEADGIWKIAAVQNERSANPGPGEVCLRGCLSDGVIRYGIEQYPLSADLRRRIAEEISRTGWIRADVAVGPQGRSSVLRLHVGDSTYEF